jgi:polysaccharide export outer membrane protein
VTQDGKISLDIVGEIDAANQTTSELERNIIRQMSRYNKSISQAVVRVLEYNYNKVFVSGQVQTPGKYTFENIPDLWTIINEAGGITELGDLTRVLIIRGGDEAGQVEVVNVSAMVSSGRIEELPKIRRGDTIEIPRRVAGLPAATLSESMEMRNLFYVIGEVNEPGAINLEKNIDILDAIALAGGPTEEANLSKARIISKDGRRTQVARVNLDHYTNRAVPGRLFVKPEDVIFLPRKSRGFLGLGATEWVAIIGSVSTFLIVANTLNLFGMGDEE